jgi:hypothetical protein
MCSGNNAFSYVYLKAFWSSHCDGILLHLMCVSLPQTLSLPTNEQPWENGCAIPNFSSVP